MLPFGYVGSLFDPFENLEKSFNRNEERQTASFRTDIRDLGDRFLLEAELPGYEKENIGIHIDGDYLTIHAEPGETDSAENYIQRERRLRVCERRFGISGISTDHIGAEYRNGILRLELPKQQPEKPPVRKIEVR